MTVSSMLLPLVTQLWLTFINSSMIEWTCQRSFYAQDCMFSNAMTCALYMEYVATTMPHPIKISQFSTGNPFLLGLIFTCRYGSSEKVKTPIVMLLQQSFATFLKYAQLANTIRKGPTHVVGLRSCSPSEIYRNNVQWGRSRESCIHAFVAFVVMARRQSACGSQNN